MLQKLQNGLFVELENRLRTETSNDYALKIHWKNSVHVNLVHLELKYNENFVDIDGCYAIKLSRNHLRTSVNICNYLGPILPNGSLDILVTHKDVKVEAAITVQGKTGTGTHVSETIYSPAILPPIPPEIVPFFKLEGYCQNEECSDYYNPYIEFSKKEYSSFILNENQLSVGTCEVCNKPKDVRFCFNNCEYFIRAEKKNSNIFLKYDKNIARNTERYFTVSGGYSINQFKRVEITITENN